MSASSLEKQKFRQFVSSKIGAGEWGFPGASSFGSSVALEGTPIKDWLEIEAGVSMLFSSGRSEWDADLLFKKPFALSDKLEFMVGVGPAWTFSREGTKIAGEVALDFMFWPTPDRKYGWFLEPSYNQPPFSIITPAPTLGFCNPGAASLGLRTRRQSAVQAAARLPELNPHPAVAQKKSLHPLAAIARPFSLKAETREC